MKGEWIDVEAADGGSFRAYLSRPAAGRGPGLVLLQEIFGINDTMREQADAWAEEGYVVVAPDLFWRIEPGIELDYSPDGWQRAFDLFGKFDVDQGIEDTRSTIAALRRHEAVQGKVGAVGYCLGGKLAFLTAARTDVDCSVCYYGVGLEGFTGEIGAIRGPTVLHFAELDKFAPPAAAAQVEAAAEGNPLITVHHYPGVDHAFARHGGDHWDAPAASMAYSRSLAVLRRALGPAYDLSALWDAHTRYEFGERDVAATIATMVAEPYVNHIPTMTGGYGQDRLARFYEHHFIPKTPVDTKLIPVSRTVGVDRVVDEMLFCFTHDIEMDWMLPGLAPTGRYVEIPLVAIVNFRGDKLTHEHIYWDQASVLVQIGALDPQGLPVAGVETARKLLDPALPANTLMPGWRES